MHDNPVGQAQLDQPQIGFTVAKDRPKRQYTFFSVGSGRAIDIKLYQALGGRVKTGHFVDGQNRPLPGQ